MARCPHCLPVQKLCSLFPAITSVPSLHNVAKYETKALCFLCVCLHNVAEYETKALCLLCVCLHYRVDFYLIATKHNVTINPQCGQV